jgi:hypothetical protein
MSFHFGSLLQVVRPEEAALLEGKIWPGVRWPRSGFFQRCVIGLRLEANSRCTVKVPSPFPRLADMPSRAFSANMTFGIAPSLWVYLKFEAGARVSAPADWDRPTRENKLQPSRDRVKGDCSTVRN